MRLLCPWNFPGKNTGVGCHFLLQGHFSEKLCSISLKVTYLHKLFGIILQEYLSILSHLFIYINIMLYFLAQIIPALVFKSSFSWILCPFDVLLSLWIFILYWSRVDLQCCVSFRCMASGSVTHIRVSVRFQVFSHLGYYRSSLVAQSVKTMPAM